MRLTERRKEQQEKNQKDEDMRQKVELMYEQVRREAAKEKIRQQQGSWRVRTGEQRDGDLYFRLHKKEMFRCLDSLLIKAF